MRRLEPEGIRVGWQLESRQVRAENVGAKQGPGFDGHGGDLLEGPIPSQAWGVCEPVGTTKARKNQNAREPNSVRYEHV